MNGLEQQFGGQIDFLHLDVDSPTVRSVSQRYDIRGHTQYVLIDAEGKVVGRWFSYLDGQKMAADIEEILVSLE